jgi:Family of unknown function (DUF6166)
MNDILSFFPELITFRCVRLTGAVIVDDIPLDLHGSLQVRNHSPTGFAWGYGGSAPSQLALALLLKYLPPALALKYYQVLKWQWICKLSDGSFYIEVKLRSIMAKVIREVEGPEEGEPLNASDNVL